MGGTFAPEDGSISPLLVANAYYRRSMSLAVEFRFKEKISRILVDGGRVIGVETDRGRYEAPVVVDAAGPLSSPLCETAGVRIPVEPDCHEAAITEPVKPFFECMVVDIRPAPGSKNYYFYQNRHGQVVFCITPDPPIVGTDKRETSVFLPQICRRLVHLLPRLKNLRVRRTWRGPLPHDPGRLAGGRLGPGRAGADACDRHVRPGPDAGHRCRRDRRPPGHPVDHGQRCHHPEGILALPGIQGRGEVEVSSKSELKEKTISSRNEELHA